MTVPVPGSLVYTYSADDSTTSFSYPVRFLDKAEIVVILREGVTDTVQVLGSDYTISGSSWPTGGSIVFGTPPAPGKTVVIYRNTVAKQLVDLENTQRNDANAVETQLDRLAMVQQDHGRKFEGTWQTRPGEVPGTIDVIPDGHILVSDEGGNLIDGGIKGSAANSEVGQFATAAQGAAADSAVQPGDLGPVATSNDYGDLDNLPSLGTASGSDVGDFATSVQGSKADTAVQPGDAEALPTDGTVGQILVRDPDAAAGRKWTSIAAGVGDMISTAYDPAGKGEQVLTVTDAPSDPDFSVDSDKLALRGLALSRSANLSDVASRVTARANLGTFEALSDLEAATIPSGVNSVFVAGKAYVRIDESYWNLGPELVTNGGFDTDSIWGKGSGWSISGGKASFSAASTARLYQTAPASVVEGTVLLYAYDITDISSGNVAFRIGTDTDGPSENTVGHHFHIDEFNGGANDFRFVAVAGSNLSIDNASVKALPPDAIQSADGAWWGPDNALSSTDTSSDPDLSNDTDKLALRGDVDANLVLQFAADDTALKGLDIASRKAGLNLANEGWWLPTSDDISTEITAGDPRYLPTSGDATGAGGGWYRAGSIASGQKYENLGARIERTADRVMIGGEAVKYNGLADGSGGKGGFLWDLLPGASASHAWMEQQAILSVGGLYDANGGVAINGYLAGPGIGINAHILHDRSANPLAASGAWAFYGDARRDLEFATTWTAEFDIINGLPSPHTAFGPWGGNGATADGRTVALHLGSGGGAAINGTTYTADVALLIQKNSSTFYAGIAFGGQSLEPDSGTGRMHAIGMSPKQAIDWWGNNLAAGILASLVSNVTDTSVPQELAFQNLGLDYSSGGNTLFHVSAPANAATYLNVTPTVSGGSPALVAAGAASAVSLSLRSKGATSTTFLQSDASATFSATGVASGVNRLDALASATGNAVKLRAVGTDTDIDIQFTPKGSGNVRMGTHTAIGSETVTGYITIKDAGGTVRKLAVVS